MGGIPSMSGGSGGISDASTQAATSGQTGSNTIGGLVMGSGSKPLISREQGLIFAGVALTAVLVYSISQRKKRK